MTPLIFVTQAPTWLRVISGGNANLCQGMSMLQLFRLYSRQLPLSIYLPLQSDGGDGAIGIL